VIGSVLQAPAVQYGYLAAVHRYYLAGYESPENLVRCRASSPGNAGQHFLGHRDYDVLIVSRVQFAQIQEPANYASFCGYIQCLEQIIIDLLQPGGEKSHKESVYTGIGSPETLELVPAESQRLGRFQRDNRSSPSMGIADQGKLAESVPRAEDRDNDVFAAAQRYAHADMACRDQVQSVCRVALMKDHLIATVGLAPQSCDQPALLVQRQRRENRPVHEITMPSRPAGDHCRSRDRA
jgi:hypothetical protein